ncbi:GNAT family N-acetyltransferase [Chryseolinea lacunae]|uniref:GNAT family N-acetyltransferase n=1 Tax=Chryseolinea lacunae TaxID=2801331 RepID=A0ABS1KQY1_9BACT|nr:GNAT family N-acetyltransferase [Chryseolinea lacunae]MBL0741740.1 GNAT family N-acetyltransferase [Chryseolinea lacunae]
MIDIAIRPIRRDDDVAMAKVIRTVMPEFGAGGAGFAIHDPEVDNMTEAYSKPRCAYFVCVANKAVVGGGGIAPLAGGNADTCELKKMYFLPAGRGQGWGQNVLLACIDAARTVGFRYCYLETFNTMKGAMKLYERNGFLKIPGPLGNTGHFACDTFYQLDLQKPAIAK